MGDEYLKRTALEIYRKGDSQLAESLMEKLAWEGHTYRAIVARIQRLTGIDPADWEDLLKEAASR